MKLINWIIVLILIPDIISCSQRKLPILGNSENVNGEVVYSTINDFTLFDQDSNVVTLNTLKDKIHIAGFIFLSCPTVCPKMSVEMKKVYNEVAHLEDVVLLSYTIDPERDNVAQLKNYASNLGVATNRWHFLTGNKDSIMNLAINSYYATAYPDSTAPGGFTHSGGLLLVDRQNHIRGVYDGTNMNETKRLINDVNTLVKEKE